MFIQALVMHAWYISSSPCPQLSCKRLWQHPALIQLSALTYPLCTNLGNGRDFLCGLCFGHLNSWLYGALIFRFCCGWSHHCPHLQEINFWTGIIQHASSLRFTGLQARKIAIVQEALSPFPGKIHSDSQGSFIYLCTNYSLFHLVKTGCSYHYNTSQYSEWVLVCQT